MENCLIFFEADAAHAGACTKRQSSIARPGGQRRENLPL